MPSRPSTATPPRPRSGARGEAGSRSGGGSAIPPEQLFTCEDDAAGDYIADGATALARRQRANSAARFRAAFGGLGGWAAAPLRTRLSAAADVRAVAACLALGTAARVDPAYIAQANVSWGYWLACLDPQMSLRFTAAAAALGWDDKETGRQWCTLAKLAAVASLPPSCWTARSSKQPARHSPPRSRRIAAGLPNTFTTPLHGLSATLAALGILDKPDRKRVPDRGQPGHWKTLEQQVPVMTATMRRYLAQLGISMRPGSVALIDTTLRHLASYLTGHHPDVTTVAVIGRTHIEGFKTWMTSRPGYRGSSGPAKTTTGMRISHLRGFFDRITEWGYEDAPARSPVFAGDMPIRDRPLPRFLDDADAAKLMSAARDLPDLFDRVCVEVLARTGLRKGEFLRLATERGRDHREPGMARTSRSASCTLTGISRSIPESGTCSASGSSTAGPGPARSCSQSKAAPFRRPASMPRCAAPQPQPGSATPRLTSSGTR